MIALHDFIESHKDEILRQWTGRMIDSAFAEGLSVPELVGVMPDYLSSLGAAPPSDPSQLDGTQRDLVERHLAHRLRQGASLNEILSEFATLSRCVAATLDRAPPEAQLLTRDAARMFTELHAACVSSMRIFNEQLLEDEQNMKRYLRLLQRAADRGGELDGGRWSMQPLLEEALALICRALMARAAALHLDDCRTGERIASVAAGIAGDAVAAQVHTLDGATASTAAPVADGEVEYSDMPVSDAVRDSGVDALIAVRPAARHALRCVLYIGAGRGQTFLAHEIRLAESLAEALLIHLDHAHLCAALAARAAEARTECHRPPIDIAACDLAQLAREVIAELRAVHGDRFLLCGNRSVPGMWSSDQLRRAIWNLGDSAVRHGADGGTVVITVKRRDGGAELGFRLRLPGDARPYNE